MIYSISQNTLSKSDTITDKCIIIEALPKIHDDPYNNLFDISYSKIEELLSTRQSNSGALYSDSHYVYLNAPDFSSKYEVMKKTLVIFDTQRVSIFTEQYDNMLEHLTQVIKSVKRNDIPDIVIKFLSEILSKDYLYLQKIEECISEFENQVLMEKHKKHCKELNNFRRRITILKRYYEQLYNVIDSLMGVFDEQYSEDIMKVSESADRLTESVLNLRDFMEQVREAYQQQLDISLNSTMKFLTVITAFFLPLSFIATWYGMNLKMPEIEWEYSYYVVIAITLIITVGSIWFFSKRKWF